MLLFIIIKEEIDKVEFSPLFLCFFKQENRLFCYPKPENNLGIIETKLYTTLNKSF